MMPALAIICRRVNSDLITIWNRPESIEDLDRDLKWLRANRSDEYEFAGVVL